MAGKKSRERQVYWQEMLDRQAGSGLSIRRFCVRERVSEPSFYMWRRRLSGRRSSETRSELTMPRVADSREGREFIPLKLLDVSGALEVIHPVGYRIRVTGEVNGADLQRVLDVLDARGHG